MQTTRVGDRAGGRHAIRGVLSFRREDLSNGPDTTTEHSASLSFSKN